MLPLDAAAREFKGNWKKFQSFAWTRAWDGSLSDPENWGIYYTHNRDSGLLDQSNSAAIAAILDPLCEAEDDNPDCMAESHNHWACGWVDGYSIRVYRPDGSITPAFQALHEILESLANYPVLDDEDYSRREYDSAIESIRDNGPADVEQPDGSYLSPELPDGWESDVFGWLWNQSDWQSVLENRDDQGAYVSGEAIVAAWTGLGWLPKSDATDSDD